jgi:hypothetical protein
MGAAWTGPPTGSGPLQPPSRPRREAATNRPAPDGRTPLPTLGLLALAAAGLHAPTTAAAADPPRPEPVAFGQKDGELHVRVGGRPVATYVWSDTKVRRPYFAHLHAPNGARVTRTHPPVEGKDATDHADMHPGLWLAFGDLGGADFWRNKGAVEHAGFVARPEVTKTGGAFAVRNRYRAGGRTVCEEMCRVGVSVTPAGYLIDWASEFTGPADFHFGD